MTLTIFLSFLSGFLGYKIRYIVQNATERLVVIGLEVLTTPDPYLINEPGF